MLEGPLPFKNFFFQVNDVIQIGGSGKTSLENILSDLFFNSS